MEIIANAIQTVQANQNVYFTDTIVNGNASISHRDNSGLVTLRGVTNSQCRARFMVTFGANVAIPTGGTAEAISLAIAIDGEPVPASAMIVTPSAVEQYFNVQTSVFIDVIRGCCSQISVVNTSSQAIAVQNGNLIITREA